MSNIFYPHAFFPVIFCSLPLSFNLFNNLFTHSSHPPNQKDLNNTILLKREDTQPVFSFKIRGAYNKMSQIDSAQNPNGVVACSAGNHAQGVALSARMLRIKATIVMPVATPTIKVRSVQAHGGDEGFVTVKLHGDTYDEAAVEAKRLVVEEGMEMIHPFDDPYVIAGQGTIGKFCPS